MQVSLHLKSTSKILGFSLCWFLLPQLKRMSTNAKMFYIFAYRMSCDIDIDNILLLITIFYEAIHKTCSCMSNLIFHCFLNIKQSMSAGRQTWIWGHKIPLRIAVHRVSRLLCFLYCAWNPFLPRVYQLFKTTSDMFRMVWPQTYQLIHLLMLSYLEKGYMNL